MTLEEALNILDLSWPRGNKLRCPAHEERTPSLHLYSKTNSFYCFSCGATGDAYGLIALATGRDIVEVLRQYGDGQEGKPARPKVSRRDMVEAEKARWQEWQATFWPKVPKDENLMLGLDRILFEVLEVILYDEEVTADELRRAVNSTIEGMEMLLENYTAVSPSSGIRRPAVQPEIPQARGPGGDGIREDPPARDEREIRLESSSGVARPHERHAQTPARLLRRRRLSS